MQENTDSQFNKLRNKINEQNEVFLPKRLKLKKKQIEILGMKKSIKEIRMNKKHRKIDLTRWRK